MAKEEKTIYIVNHSFISHRVDGVVIPREKFVAISSSLLDKLMANPVFKNLIDRKELECKDEIDDSMRTTEEQLRNAKAEIERLKASNGDSKELSDTKKELEDVKKEAIETINAKDQIINDKDQEIADLKAKLEKLSAEESAE